MSRHIVFLLVIFAFVTPLVSSAEEAIGIVTANKLNVRVIPNTNCTVVANLPKDSQVKIIRKKDKWYEIVAPNDTAVFVATPFVENDIVSKEVNLRSGPSVAYNPFGTAPPGMKLTILDRSRKNWLKIAPPPGLTAWVSSDFISVSKKEMAKLLPKPKKKPGKEDKEKPKPLEKGKNEPALARADDSEKIPERILATGEDGAKELPFIEGIDKNVAVEGILLPLAPDAVYVTHALATKVRDEYHPVCYIHSKKFNLVLWEKRKIRIRGQQRWVKGWKRPVVELERITPMWQ